MRVGASLQRKVSHEAVSAKLTTISVAESALSTIHRNSRPRLLDREGGAKSPRPPASTSHQNRQPRSWTGEGGQSPPLPACMCHLCLKRVFTQCRTSHLTIGTHLRRESQTSTGTC